MKMIAFANALRIRFATMMAALPSRFSAHETKRIHIETEGHDLGADAWPEPRGSRLVPVRVQPRVQRRCR